LEGEFCYVKIIRARPKRPKIQQKGKWCAMTESKTIANAKDGVCKTAYAYDNLMKEGTRNGN